METSKKSLRTLMLAVLIINLILFSCNQKKADEKYSEDSNNEESILVELADNNITPTVYLSTYKLIVNSSIDRKADAAEILRVKRKWPLAMQSKNPAEFESILAKNFTFKGTDSFYNRSDYIKDRTSSDEWIITFVKYENVTLQFIGEIGILSYKNHVTNKSQKTNKIENEEITWVDIYVKEDGEWKIGASHSIDYRLGNVPDSLKGKSD